MEDCESCRFWIIANVFKQCSNNSINTYCDNCNFGGYMCDELGYCRRFPPNNNIKYIQEEEGNIRNKKKLICKSDALIMEDANICHTFPITEKNNWCGEWKYKN